MTKLIDSLKARRDAAKTEGGFSLIDVVVTVAIIVALSVGGFIAYSGLVDNAKQAAVTGAADQLRTAATVAANDSDTPEVTTTTTVLAAFNGSADGISAEETNALGVATVDGGYITVSSETTDFTKTVKLG